MKTSLSLTRMTLVSATLSVLAMSVAMAAEPSPVASASTAANGGMMSQQVQALSAACQQAGGYFQYGTVNAPPASDYPDVVNFKPGKRLKDIPLSHTHIEITSKIDNTVYDVAIDNVFASDYDPHKKEVPASYCKAITAGSTIYFCGGNPGHEPYQLNGQQYAQQGFDWVHTNCESPNSMFADGWLKTESGDNLTNNHKYCYLWGNNN